MWAQLSVRTLYSSNRTTSKGTGMRIPGGTMCDQGCWCIICGVARNHLRLGGSYVQSQTSIHIVIAPGTGMGCHVDCLQSGHDGHRANQEDPVIIPFQLLRGALWTYLSVVIVRMIETKRCQVSLAVALTFAALLALPLARFPIRICLLWWRDHISLKSRPRCCSMAVSPAG